MTDNKTLLIEINSFCAKNGMSPSGFGRLFLNNPNFVSDLEKPDEEFSPQLKTVNKIRLRMKTYKPEKKGNKNEK